MKEGVLYFGDPAGALALLDRGVALCGIVHGRRGGTGWRTLVPRVRNQPRWHRPELDNPTVAAALADTRPALIVSAFYPRRIPPAILALAPGINVHPSDLPRWRGPDPTFWTIRSGDVRSAICVHVLTEALDAGDVLHRVEVEVDPRETAAHLAQRLEAEGASQIAEVAAQILAGNSPTPSPQTGDVTWAPLVPDDDVEIDWSSTAVDVDRLVRAASPEPGAFTGIEGELLIVYAGHPIDAGQFASLPAGTPFFFDERVAIRCGQDAYRLDRVCVGRKRLGGRAFAELLR